MRQFWCFNCEKVKDFRTSFISLFNFQVSISVEWVQLVQELRKIRGNLFCWKILLYDGNLHLVYLKGHFSCIDISEYKCRVNDVARLKGRNGGVKTEWDKNEAKRKSMSTLQFFRFFSYFHLRQLTFFHSFIIDMTSSLRISSFALKTEKANSFKKDRRKKSKKSENDFFFLLFTSPTTHLWRTMSD